MATGKRNARIEITASAAGMGPGLNDARRRLRTFEREQKTAARAQAREQARANKEAQRENARLARDVGGMGRGVIGGLATAAGFDIAGGIGGMAAEVMDTHKEMLRFQIDSQLSAAEADRFYEALGRVSDATGQSRNSLVHAAHAYQILTGDAKGAVESAQLFAEVANASGASMDDIGAAAAAMSKTMKIDPKQFREGFDVILSMGHKGAVELRDVAAEIPTIAPQFAQFGAGGGTKGLTEMMAALQVVRHGFGSASEAATGLSSLMTGIVKKRKKLEAAGIRVFNKDGSLRDFFEIVDQMKAKKMDLTSLMDELGRTEGVRAALQIVQAGNSEMHDLFDTALGSNQVMKDNATYMESATGKIAKAWEQIKNTIGDALSPERVQAFADILTTAGDAFKGLFNAGKKIRGFLGGDGKQSVALEDTDVGLYQQQVAAMMAGKPMSEDELAARKRAARTNIAGVEAHNAAVDRIMEGEVDDHTTGKSLAAAMAAKYGGGLTVEQGALGARSAGQTYLRNAGFQDPIALIDQTTKKVGDAVAAAIAKAMVTAPVSVKVGSEPVVKAHSNSTLHRTRTGAR